MNWTNVRTGQILIPSTIGPTDQKIVMVLKVWVTGQPRQGTRQLATGMIVRIILKRSRADSHVHTNVTQMLRRGREGVLLPLLLLLLGLLLVEV